MKYLVVNELNEWIGFYDSERNENLKEFLQDEGVYSDDIKYYAYKVGSEYPELELNPKYGMINRLNNSSPRK